MVELADTKFMSADQKRKVLRHWESFLRGGLKWTQFTEALYQHLIMHCSFIAHYDKGGFYGTYFENGDDRAQFLSQFDERRALFTAGKMAIPPKSIEYGMTYWAEGDYEDINREMIRIAGKYIPQLLENANNSQKQADIAEAKRLLAKHGITGR